MKIAIALSENLPPAVVRAYEFVYDVHMHSEEMKEWIGHFIVDDSTG